LWSGPEHEVGHERQHEERGTRDDDYIASPAPRSYLVKTRLLNLIADFRQSLNLYRLVSRPFAFIVDFF
jgi:hypothetical protein